MKLITERSEIAQAINYHKMPVITIDIAEADEYGLKSCHVLIDAGKFDDGNPHYVEAEVRAFSDESEFCFHFGSVACLKASFGYEDISEMLEWRNAPIVKPDEDVILMIHDSEKKICYPLMVLHTGKKVDSFCTKPMFFEDKDYSTKPFLALCKKED